MRPSTGMALAFATLALLSPHDVLACSCAPPGPACGTVHAADAVFVAEVLRVGPSRYQEARAFSMETRATIRVLEIFKGDVPGLMDVFTAATDGACGYPFGRTGRYVIYAVRDQNTGQHMTHACSRTMTLAEAAQDLPYLRRFARDPAAFGRIRGTVVDMRESVKQPTPVHEARVIAEGATGQRLEVRSRADGSYHLDLAPGSYEVRAEVAVGPHLPLLSYAVEVPGEGRCRVVDFHVLPALPRR